MFTSSYRNIVIFLMLLLWLLLLLLFFSMTVTYVTFQLTGEISHLKIGVLKEGFEHPSSEADVDKLVRNAADRLGREAGAKVEEVSVKMHYDGISIRNFIVKHIKYTVINYNLTFEELKLTLANITAARPYVGSYCLRPKVDSIPSIHIDRQTDRLRVSRLQSVIRSVRSFVRPSVSQSVGQPVRQTVRQSVRMRPSVRLSVSRSELLS